MRPVLPLILRAIAIAALVLLAAPRPGLALCSGQDLIAALPAAERAALEARAESRPFSRGNLWRATRGDQVIDLAGTYHLPDPRHEALLARVLPLLDDAAILMVEAGPDEEARLKEELGRRPDFMLMVEGPTLPELLDEPDWQAVSAAMRLHGIPPFIASRLRPWYVAMMLGIPACALEGVKQGGQGLDHRLIAAARGRQVPVVALEPYDTLFNLFGTLPQEGELDMLRASLVMSERPEDMTVTLANAYFAGRAQLLWDFTLERAISGPGVDADEVRHQFALMEEVLMTGRNRSWISGLLKAAERGPVLAAFGALHLPGETGVLALLQAEGFAVTPLP